MRFSEKVQQDQTMLAKAGFYHSAIDGLWGNRSREAMRLYCGDKGLQWVRIDRNRSNQDVTISRVFVDGEFVCHGLEDEFRAVKKWGETRIPAGFYRMNLRREGGFHNRYLRMFGKRFHRGMLHVLDVKNFTYILHHVGNYDRDTSGCLLLGRADYKAWAVWQSKKTYQKYYERVVDAADQGRLVVTYEDNDQ